MDEEVFIIAIAIALTSLWGDMISLAHVIIIYLYMNKEGGIFF
jgi:hypothetical protein